MYKIIRQALSEELAGFCYDYFCSKKNVVKLFLDTKYKSCRHDGDWGGWTDPQIPDTYSHYGDLVMDTLLSKLKPLIELETELKLYSTYSFARIYKNGDELKRHKDRYSCEVSATLNLGGDPWSIFLEPSGEEGKDGLEVLLKHGDLLIYEGEKMEHWREKFKGESCGQVFFHYNNAALEGAKDNEYDHRPLLGSPANFKGLYK
tara:strand:- start:265 stop:876 length:612 start_codon:yes stop_codon:yes gene_type:complete